MMGYYNGYDWSGWMIAVMLTWPLLIAAAVWAMVVLTRGHAVSSAPESPVEILNRRFAEGQISEQEYISGRDVLKNEGSRTATSG